MKDFNTYEKMVIKKHINPSVCFMTSGSSWEYLNDLQWKSNADVTILGSNPAYIKQYNKIKDYDMMILESQSGFSDGVFCDFMNIANIISDEYKNKIFLVYSFLNSNGSFTACQGVSDCGSFTDIGSVNGMFNSRDLLDIAAKNYINFEKNEKKTKSYK